MRVCVCAHARVWDGEWSMQRKTKEQAGTRFYGVFVENR